MNWGSSFDLGLGADCFFSSFFFFLEGCLEASKLWEVCLRRLGQDMPRT